MRVCRLMGETACIGDTLKHSLLRLLPGPQRVASERRLGFRPERVGIAEVRQQALEHQYSTVMFPSKLPLGEGR